MHVTIYLPNNSRLFFPVIHGLLALSKSGAPLSNYVRQKHSVNRKIEHLFHSKAIYCRDMSFLICYLCSQIVADAPYLYLTAAGFLAGSGRPRHIHQRRKNAIITKLFEARDILL